MTAAPTAHVKLWTCAQVTAETAAAGGWGGRCAHSNLWYDVRRCRRTSDRMSTRIWRRVGTMTAQRRGGTGSGNGCGGGCGSGSGGTGTATAIGAGSGESIKRSSVASAAFLARAVASAAAWAAARCRVALRRRQLLRRGRLLLEIS